jgi:hypothetical protein
MHAEVTVCFAPDQSVEFRVPFSSEATAQAAARNWLDRTYTEFGCEPARPTGKVLLLDKIIDVAEAAGLDRFTRDRGWGELYAQAVSAALDRTHVRVDLAQRTVGT